MNPDLKGTATAKRTVLLTMLVAIVIGLITFVFKTELSKLVNQIFATETISAQESANTTSKSSGTITDKNFPLPLPLPFPFHFPTPDESKNGGVESSVSSLKPGNNEKPFVQQYFELIALAKVGNTKAAIAAFELLDRCYVMASFAKMVEERSSEVRIEVPSTQAQIARQKLLENQCPTLTPAMIDSRASILTMALDAGDVLVASVAFYAGPGFDIMPYYDESDPALSVMRKDPRITAWAQKIVPLLERAAFAGDKYALYALSQVYDPRGYGYLREDNVFKYAVIELVNAQLHPNSARLMASPIMIEVLNRLPAEQQTLAKLEAQKIVSACCVANNQPPKYRQITEPPYMWKPFSGL